MNHQNIVYKYTSTAMVNLLFAKRPYVFLLFFTTIVHFSFAQEFLKLRVVYDFEIGDEFHFKTHSEESGQNIYGARITDELINIIITGKSFSADNDTVFYTQKVYHRIIRSYGVTDTIFTEAVFYTKLDMTTDEINVYMGEYPNVSNPKIYNGRITNSFSEGGNGGGSGIRYAEGLGLCSRWGIQDWEGYHNEYKSDLVYFKKGNEAWGSKATAIPEAMSQSKYSLFIYPNPAADQAKLLREGKEDAELVIYDCGGREIHRESYEGKSKILNTAMLNSGIYILSAGGSDKVERAILVVER